MIIHGMSLNIKPLMPLSHPQVTLKARRLKLAASSTEVEADVSSEKEKMKKRSKQKLDIKHK